MKGVRGATANVQFTRDFDWYPPEKNGRVHIAFKAGMTLRVRKACAADAIAAGAATPIAKENENGHHIN
jgi:hypothetical protein